MSCELKVIDYEVRDMKYEDIAQITGTTVGALKASYHIAYEKIKKELI